MDDLLEFVFEVIFEIGEEVSNDKKISKWIRYPIMVLMGIFYIGVIGLLFVVGLSALKENLLFGLFLIGLALFFAIGLFVKFRKIYKLKKNGGSNEENIRNKESN